MAACTWASSPTAVRLAWVYASSSTATSTKARQGFPQAPSACALHCHAHAHHIAILLSIQNSLYLGEFAHECASVAWACVFSLMGTSMRGRRALNAAALQDICDASADSMQGLSGQHA